MANRNYVFTLNNPTHQLQFENPPVKYAVWQLERGEAGTPHYQGYIELTKPMKVSGMKKLAGLERAHFEKRMGSQEQAIAYSKKEESRVEGPWEFGKQAVQGCRDSQFDPVIDAIKGGAKKRDIDTAFPGVAARYDRWVDRMLKYAKEDKVKKITEWPNPKPWQKQILEIIKTEADRRTIHWYYDSVGRQGKTEFCTYLIDAHEAFYTCGGKVADIAFAYDHEPVVLMDIPRESDGFCSYKALEMFKNGLITSSKYESALKRVNIPHVFVFANFMPDQSKFSADRWHIVDITPAQEPEVRQQFSALTFLDRTVGV